jgi:hexose kinase, 1-phosphofructokinase family
LINTLTLNPAIDKVLYVDKLEKNVTCRVQNSAEIIGGKGTHVSINLKLLGINNRAFGISHGKTGESIVNSLAHYDLDVCFVQKEHLSSRTNYLLVENTNDCTVIAEKGVQLSDCDIHDIISRMQLTMQAGDYLVLSGDASNCDDPAVYNTILSALSNKNLKVFLDTSGATLKECIACAPFLIKPNLDELSTLCGRNVSSDEDDVMDAIHSLDAYNIETIAVSMGSAGSVIKTPDGIYKANTPEVTVFNTVGCGDSFLAGLIYGIYNGLSTIDTIKLATAVSAATAESPYSVGFDLARATELINKVDVVQIG